MLVLVSFGLVLLATILLVVGLLTDDGLTLIYFSIGASFTAAIVLYLAFRMARPKTERAKSAPEPLDPDLVPEPEPVAVSADATRVQPAAAMPAPPVVSDAEPEPEPSTVFAADPTPARDDEWTADDDWADDGDFEVEFPIADYDDLTVAEIMPLLPQLYTDELGVVAERERTGKNRSAILDRLDELAASGTDADALDGGALAGGEEAEAAPVAPAPAPTPAPARPAVTVPSLSEDADDDDLPFPIADYDELSVDQIVPLLAQLEDDELEDVKAREAAGQARRSVIAEIDRQLGLVDAVGADTSDAGWDVDQPTAPPVSPATPTPATQSTPEPAPAPHAEPAEGSALAIAGYDGMTVAQIRPLLAGLTDRELRSVLEHEVARDNRRTIITEIERRLDSRGGETAPAPAAPTPAKRVAKRAAKRPQRVAKRAAAPRFPIDDYDQLRVAEIRPRLAGLTKAELEQVRDRELAGAGRKTILTEIENRLR